MPVVLDLTAVVIFAVTGALAAARAQLDPVGFVFLGCLTAVGGGTVRDMLLGRHPVFWIADPAPVALAAGAALVVFLMHHLLTSRLAWLVWLDAAALSVAVAAGLGVAQASGHPAWSQVVMGVVTGCMGGLLRDVVVGQVPLVLRQRELYVTAALAGAGAGVAMRGLGALPPLPLLACVGTTFLLRAGSIRWGWRLPAVRPRPPRD